jgi:hypothetical protein
MSEANPRDPVESSVHRSVTRSGAARSAVVRLFTDKSFAQRAVRYALRLPTPLATEDRRVLEQIIFKHYAARDDIRSILFVGCQWYTKHYERLFPQRNYWTIDQYAPARKYGARQHVTAPLERLDEFFPAGYFDLVICNGVYGYGLDTLEQCELALTRCYDRLRADGEFVFGWNNVPARTPVPLESIESLKRFRKVVFPEFNSWRYVTDTPYAHTYDFYRR